MLLTRMIESSRQERKNVLNETRNVLNRRKNILDNRESFFDNNFAKRGHESSARFIPDELSCSNPNIL